jgi:hypothetical protein
MRGNWDKIVLISSQASAGLPRAADDVAGWLLSDFWFTFSPQKLPFDLSEIKE